MSDPTSLFSSLKGLYLKNSTGLSLNILLKNKECQFERMELSESIQELVPNGTVIVRDTIDIISYIRSNNINTVTLQFFDGTYSDLSITSVAHITNAASDTEENFISIGVSNSLYKYMQSSALLDVLPYYSPQVYKISEFVDYVANTLGTTAIVDVTSNYMLFKPLNTVDSRSEFASTNVLQYLNYLAGYATDQATLHPRYMFWTNWSNQLIFKFFSDLPEYDPAGSDNVITYKNNRFAIYDSDVPALRLQSQNNKLYRKIYFMNSDPGGQYISKNYFYIRKTPKILDTPSANTNTTETLLYQYQDEGQKYNVELISSNGTNSMVPGADQIDYESHWGHYNAELAPSDRRLASLLNQEYGSSEQYYGLKFNGITGYQQFVDNTEMWKMMFDITETHPNYPDSTSLNDSLVDGQSTYLQKILDIRYDVLKQNIEIENYRLDTFRKIEKENFIMYVLCCMAKEENCFFAKLTKYQIDNTYGSGLSGSNLSIIGGVSGATFAPYRYNWVKLNFNSPYGDTGPLGTVGSGGTAYYFHNVEAWSEDPFMRGNTTQDETWAINLNERSVGKDYLPPGWVTNLPTGFRWRPIGAPSNATSTSGASTGDIRHIVRMCQVPVSDLLLDSRQLVPSNYLGKYLYYFTAENVVDGSC